MKEKLKNSLIAMGLSALLAGGICGYFKGQKNYLTYEEYLATIHIYNNKIEEIKKDCENDIRCYKDKIIFKEVKNKKDVVNKLNEWIEKDYEEPNFYKLKKYEQQLPKQ